MDLSCLLLLFSLFSHAGAFDLGQTTRCVPVPQQMSVCQDVPYSEMRLPNLLGHSSLEEAVPRSDDWRTLLHTGCHPQARAFVCSLVAPVCLDRYVQTLFILNRDVLLFSTALLTELQETAADFNLHID